MDFLLWLLALLLMPFSVSARETSSSMTIESVETQAVPDVTSVLRMAATAAESYATTSNGSYDGLTVRVLHHEGMPRVKGIELSVPISTRTRYCIEANGTDHFDSNEGDAAPGPC